MNTHQFWIAEPITDGHALKVDLHFGSGVVLVDVVRNGRYILPSIRLHTDRKYDAVTTPVSQCKASLSIKSYILTWILSHI